jgi:hypothetical protein
MVFRFPQEPQEHGIYNLFTSSGIRNGLLFKLPFVVDLYQLSFYLVVI